MIYADSSALVSLYSADACTHTAVALFTQLSPPLCFTLLHELELSNALELRRFRQQITDGQAAASAQAIQADLQGGTLMSLDVHWPLVLASAVNLSRQHSRALGTRSLDILHVAAALECSATLFVTFDKRQAALARLEGLHVLGA